LSTDIGEAFGPQNINLKARFSKILGDGRGRERRVRDAAIGAPDRQLHSQKHLKDE
jgi:hypothetical protein